MTTVMTQLLISASRHPACPAVASASESISYAELEAIVGGLARWLRMHGVSDGTRVGLWLDKSCMAVATIYAIMSSGGVYVPLDPAASPASVNHLLLELGGALVITDEARARQLSSTDARVSVLRIDDFDRRDTSGFDVSSQRGGSDLAAIINTSGSTGQPKGAAITHDNLVAFTQWATREFSVSTADRLLSHAPFHFDLSFFDLFTASGVGACVVLATKREMGTPTLLAELCLKTQVTIWQSVPYALSLLALAPASCQRPMMNVRHVLFAGERMPRSTLLALPSLFPNARLHNVYGCTETNDTFIYTLPTDVSTAPDPLPIGRVLPHIRYRIVDGDGADVPRGERGILMIAGSTVMAGYIGADGAPRAVGAFYETKDIVSEDAADECCHFHGRADNVVKTQGFRVNLTEVEDALSSHPALEEVAIIAVPDAILGHSIVALLRTRAGCERPELALELRSFCSSVLPRHAIPREFRVVERFPKSSNGKLDRKALKNFWADLSGARQLSPCSN